MGVDPGDGHELGPLSRDVLAVLIEATEPDEGLTRTEAIARVEQATTTDDDRLWETTDPETISADVDDILDGLLNRGYLYEVEGELRITDRDVIE